MKKLLALVLASILCLCCLASCNMLGFHSIGYQETGTERLLMDGYAPKWAKPGDTVVLRTGPIMDADLAFYANGEKIENTHNDSDYWEYTFIMPDEDVVITHDIVGGFGYKECVEHIDEDKNGRCDNCGRKVEHEHTGEWLTSESTHFYQYTCGCESPDIAELHLDGDDNGLCDVCGYEYKEGNILGEHSISYANANTQRILMDGYAPTRANPGDTVVLRAGTVMDAELDFYANGVKLTRTHADSDYWEYIFTMPDEDVVITHEMRDGFLVEECDEHIDENKDGICDICGYVSADSLDIAKIVLDYEQSLRDEIAQLCEEHPEYIYYYHAVIEVGCTLILDKDASADDIVAKYDMKNRFASADILALNAIKMVMIIFDRNEFTEDIHQMVKQISEEEALVKSLNVDMYRDWYKSYMPKIEYYTNNAKKLNYTASQVIGAFNGKDRILRSKVEYDAYLDELLKTAKYDYEKEKITAARDLYDEAFFEENALIITRMITRGSGSIKLTVNNLYVSGNKVYVVIRTDEPGAGTADMQYAFFGFAVNKKHVANIDEVITLE